MPILFIPSRTGVPINIAQSEKTARSTGAAKVRAAQNSFGC
jgi:hypothetical protein